MNADGDLIARAAKISKVDRNLRSWRNAVRHAGVHPVVAWIAGGTEIQNLGEPAAECNLRRNHTALSQAGGVH
jgi:hypothetical protein